MKGRPREFNVNWRSALRQTLLYTLLYNRNTFDTDMKTLNVYDHRTLLTNVNYYITILVITALGNYR